MEFLIEPLKKEKCAENTVHFFFFSDICREKGTGRGLHTQCSEKSVVARV